MAGIFDPYIIVDQCLQWIGFGIPNQRASISTKAGFNSLDDLKCVLRDPTRQKRTSHAMGNISLQDAKNV